MFWALLPAHKAVEETHQSRHHLVTLQQSRQLIVLAGPAAAKLHLEYALLCTGAVFSVREGNIIATTQG